MTLSCGIDFGTSNSLVATASGADVRVHRIDPANADPHLLPTLLYFSRYGWSRIGRAATHAYQEDPDGRYIRSLKAALPEVHPDDRFRIWTRSHTLADLAALVLRRLREELHASLGRPVEGVTLGRPVRFSADREQDRRAQEILRQAALAAGFSTVRFVPEPEAATRYYFAGGAPESTVLVFDFGGGTLDLCLARFSERNGPRGYRVLATGGAHIGGGLLDRLIFESHVLPHLGKGQKWRRGLDLPNALYNRLVNPDANWRISESEYRLEVRRLVDLAGPDASLGLRALRTVVDRRLGPDLFDAIEAAKVRLSSQEETEIRLERPDLSIVEPLTREDIRALFREQLDAIRALISDTLARGRVRVADVDRVLLAGGSSALLCTQELLADIFGAERVPLRPDLFTSIVRGLALDAAQAAS